MFVCVVVCLGVGSPPLLMLGGAPHSPLDVRVITSHVVYFSAVRVAVE